MARHVPASRKGSLPTIHPAFQVIAIHGRNNATLNEVAEATAAAAAAAAPPGSRPIEWNTPPGPNQLI